VPYISATPKPPYYAVILTSINAPVDHTEHTALSARLLERAKTFSGFLGIEGSQSPVGERPHASSREGQRTRTVVLALDDSRLQGRARVR
jgi:hypothetical protein